MDSDDLTASPTDPVVELVELAREQLRWIKIAALPQVRDRLIATLASSEQRRAYELCDGTRTSKQVAAEVGVAKSTVSTWATAWRELGLAEQVEERKIKHLISLASLGIPVTIEEE